MKALSLTNPSLQIGPFAIPLAAPLLVIYAAIGAVLAPAFISPNNLISVLFSVAVLLPAVIGMQLLLVLGRFDLSVGATASLAGMVAALSLARYHSIPLAICLALSLGILVGLINGIMVSRLRVDPLIATLAMMGITSSLALVINDGRIVAGLPSGFGWIITARIAGIPYLILIALCLVCVAGLAAAHIVVFRRFYAVGANPEAASHAGINIKLLVTFGFILTGLGAAVVGTLQASRTLSASPLQFQSLAIEAIAACLIGGSALTGGRGGIVGAAIGLIVVCATNNLVVILGISVYWKECAIGLLLLSAVLGSPIVNRIRGLLSKHQNNHAAYEISTY